MLRTPHTVVHKPMTTLCSRRAPTTWRYFVLCCSSHFCLHSTFLLFFCPLPNCRLPFPCAHTWPLPNPSRDGPYYSRHREEYKDCPACASLACPWRWGVMVLNATQLGLWRYTGRQSTRAKSMRWSISGPFYQKARKDKKRTQLAPTGERGLTRGHL